MDVGKTAICNNAFIDDNTPQRLTDCLGLPLVDPRLMRRKSNVRMTARASCKTDEKVQLSPLPPVSYSPTPKPTNIASTTEEGGSIRDICSDKVDSVLVSDDSMI